MYLIITIFANKYFDFAVLPIAIIYIYLRSIFTFRRGTVGAIIKSELVKACQCFGNKNRLNNDNNVYGSAMGGLNGNGINGSGYRYGRPSNGSDPKSGSSVKNGHNFYQAQALLRKDTGEDVNSQL